MFGFIKSALQKVYNQFTSKIAALFGNSTIDAQTLKELELILISADTGVKTTRTIIDNLKKQFNSGTLAKGTELKKALEQELLTVLQKNTFKTDCSVYMLVGINGSGKTTFASKLAYQFKQQNKKVLLVAADTFRAAAPEQLTRWAEKIGVSIALGKENQDPASVVFAGCEQFKKEGFDILIIDTAGRLQTKSNLMKELEKVRKVVGRQLPETSICTLLTVDAMLGQNSLEQAKLFNESTQLNGIVLTKMDGTGKGGIVFGISQELGIPVAYISYGEQVDQLKTFDAQGYVHDLINQ